LEKLAEKGGGRIECGRRRENVETELVKSGNITQGGSEGKGLY